jgi:hypothetical protein
MKARLRLLISIALAGVAFLNLWDLNLTLRRVKTREADDAVVLEDRLRFVRDALMKAGYRRGDIGYMPAGVLSGRPRTLEDDKQWAIVRYVMIPWNVRQDSLDAPYILIDGTRTGGIIGPPVGFTQIYDSMSGLVLVRKLAPK